MAAPNPLLPKYIALRNSVASKISDPALRARSLQNFDADPRVQKLRQAAGLAPLSTAQQGVQTAARQSLTGRVLGGISDFLGATEAGGEKALADIPTRAKAAADYYLPRGDNSLGDETPVPQAKSYADQLALERAANDQQRARSDAGNITGQVLGAGVGATLAGKAIGASAARLAATETPALAQAGNFLQKLATFNKGQKLINAGKLATIGGAAGGVQAAGTGEDIPTGIAEGAVAAPLVAGGAKVAGAGFMRAAQVLSAPFTDVLKLPNAARVLGKITSATTDQIQAEAAKIRAANPNANPTLFELLPLADRNRIMGRVASKSDNVAEQAGSAITARAKQLAPEMQAQVSQILQPNRQAIQDGLVSDLTAARGGTPVPGDDDLAAKAINSTTDMQAFRKAESDAIMAPHRDKIVDSLNGLIPSITAGDGTRLEVDPEISNAIRTVAGSARSVPTKPLSVDRVVDMIQKLKSPSASLDPNIAADAQAHLQSKLENVDPDVAQSAQQMNNAYAARSRMIEGMSAGQDTQLRDPIDTGTSAKSARLVTNAYDTPEGDAGRALGQGNALTTKLGAGSGPGLRLANDIAGTSNDIGRELQQNLGPDAAPIISAGQANSQSAQALGTALNQIKGGAPDNSTPLQALTQVAAAFHPTSFASTKAKGIMALVKMAGIPENRASTIIDMVFSQDPALQAKAVNALGNETTGAFTKYLAGVAGQTAAANDPANTPSPKNPATPAAQPDYSKMSDADLMKEVGQPQAPAASSAQPDYSKMSDADLMKEVGAAAPDQPADSPYAGKLASIYANENPDVVSLVQRQKQQESGGNQAAVSSKGAVGTMQVMPTTAPVAAKLAGVPWDEKAYKNDGTYNEILGHAYMANLLRKYGGDVSQALAAYNAGPGRVDAALATHGGNFLTALPPETQDYVAKVGG